MSLQPWRAYGVDGVILFSDILTPLPAMGVDFSISEAGGITIDPIRTREAFKRMTDHGPFDPENACALRPMRAAADARRGRCALRPMRARRASCAALKADTCACPAIVAHSSMRLLSRPDAAAALPPALPYRPSGCRSWARC